MLDLAAMNARIVYMETVREKFSCHRFPIQLAEELTPHQNQVENIPEEILPMLMKCHQYRFMGYSSNKAKTMCILCQKIVCGKCAKCPIAKTAL